jgi:hypothetical protein
MFCYMDRLDVQMAKLSVQMATLNVQMARLNVQMWGKILLDYFLGAS